MKKALLASLVLCLTACQAVKLDPVAQKVRLTNNEPGKECEFLGDVTGNQGDFFTEV